MNEIIVGSKPSVSTTPKCKLMVSIMELNHSNIVLPGQPPPPQLDPRIKFIGQFFMPGPQGPVGIGVVGETRDEVLEKLKIALPNVMRDFHYISIEQFELTLGG